MVSGGGGNYWDKTPWSYQAFKLSFTCLQGTEMTELSLDFVTYFSATAKKKYWHCVWKEKVKQYIVLDNNEIFGDVNSPAEIGPKYARGENRVYKRFYCRFLIRTIGPFILWNISIVDLGQFFWQPDMYYCIVETLPPPHDENTIICCIYYIFTYEVSSARLIWWVV